MSTSLAYLACLPKSYTRTSIGITYPSRIYFIGGLSDIIRNLSFLETIVIHWHSLPRLQAWKRPLLSLWRSTSYHGWDYQSCYSLRSSTMLLLILLTDCSHPQTKMLSEGSSSAVYGETVLWYIPSPTPTGLWKIDFKAIHVHMSYCTHAITIL